jgi:hypothetical protein
LDGGLNKPLIFYGVELDKDDSYLRHNLSRLEKRFKERYLNSLEKNRKREEQGKAPHQTTLKSASDNKRRFQMVRLLRHLLLAEPLDLSL